MRADPPPAGPHALIVVDVQPDFCEGGALAITGGNRVAEQVANLLESEHGYQLIVATRDHHIDPGDHFSEQPDFVDSWPPHCVVGTPEQLLHPLIDRHDLAAIFDKGSYAAAYSGFEGTLGGIPEGETLADYLARHGITRVDICGLAFDYCVKATALDAAELGFQTRILFELTASVHPDTAERLIGELRAAGVEVDSAH